MRRLIYPGLVVGLIIILAACGSRSQPEVAEQSSESTPAQTATIDVTEPSTTPERVPESTSEPKRSQDVEATPQPAVDATAANEEQAVPAEQDWTAVASVEDELYVLGNPDAPIRLIDYSDFL